MTPEERARSLLTRGCLHGKGQFGAQCDECIANEIRAAVEEARQEERQRHCYCKERYLCDICRERMAAIEKVRREERKRCSELEQVVVEARKVNAHWHHHGHGGSIDYPMEMLSVGLAALDALRPEDIE